MSRITVYPASLLESIYQYIKINNARIGTKELKAEFGERDTYYALSRLNATSRIRRVKILTDHGITYVYKITE